MVNNNDRLFNNEMEKYNIVLKYDPLYLLHPKIYTFGNITISKELFNNEEISNKIIKNIKIGETKYIDIEYVGEIITDYVGNGDCMHIIYLYISFIIKFLNLYDEETETYLIHGDLHGGNVCIKNDIIKFIDLSNIIPINKYHNLELNSSNNYLSNTLEFNISSQFSSICGTLVSLIMQCNNIDKSNLYNAVNNIKTKYENENKNINYENLKNEIIKELNNILKMDIQQMHLSLVKNNSRQVKNNSIPKRIFYNYESPTNFGNNNNESPTNLGNNNNESPTNLGNNNESSRPFKISKGLFGDDDDES